MEDKKDIIREFLESHIQLTEEQIAVRNESSRENDQVMFFFEGRLGAFREVMDFMIELEGVEPGPGFLH